MSRSTRFAVVLSLLAMSTACSHSFRINRTRPPVFPLAAEQKVVLLVEKDGSPPDVINAAFGITQGQVLNKWGAVEPVRNVFGTSLRNSGYTVVEGAPDIIIRVRPTGWSYELHEKSLSLSALRAGSGRLDARIEILDGRNPSTVFYGGSYWASADSADAGEPEAMSRAAQRMVNNFLSDLQPYRVSVHVELDDEDSIVEPGLELCERGQFDAAYEAFADAVARSPRSAPALYNMGVLAESRGSYDEAETLVHRATELSSKAMYYSALERIRLSRRDAQALQGQ
jgi:tetratricopeptide (TPR) repeat protein